MAVSKTQKHARVFEDANAQLREIVDGCEDEREMALMDRRFCYVAGAQWDGAVGEQFENRIKLENNRVSLAVKRIVNEYRNNRVDAKFISKDGKDSDELADMLAGLYRADQQDSYAEEALDNAFGDAVSGGFGAFRLTNEFEDEYDEEDDRQRIRWEPITDADTCVFFDPNAKKQDKSDASYCFVLTGMTPAKFEKEYKTEVSSFPKQISDGEFDWCVNDLVYVAEYFVIEDASEKVHTYRDISGAFQKHKDGSLTEEQQAEFNDIGTILVATRTVKTRKVRKYVLSGSGVLEDQGYIAGKHIPIIPVYGERNYIDGKERSRGLVRVAKDMQRLENMQLSLLGDQAASGGEEIPIFTPEQIYGHSDAWAGKAVDRPAYLTLNPIQDKDGNEMPAGAIDYTRPASVPPATAALIQFARDGLSDLLGGQEAGEQIETNMSGKAVELIQARLDMLSFIYISNFGKAVRRSAEVWLSMAGEIYDEDDRRMKAVDEQEQVEYFDIGETILNDDGEAVPKYDIAKAKMDIAIEIGPTSQSKRSATVRGLTQMMGLMTDPADQKVVAAMALQNFEGEGLGPLKDHFRRQLVAMGVMEPTEEEQEEMAAAPAAEPNAQDTYLQAEAMKSQAQAQESQADAAEAVANTRLIEARTQKTLADIDNEARETAIKAFDAQTNAATAQPQ